MARCSEVAAGGYLPAAGGSLPRAPAASSRAAAELAVVQAQVREATETLEEIRLAAEPLSSSEQVLADLRTLNKRFERFDELRAELAEAASRLLDPLAARRSLDATLAQLLDTAAEPSDEALQELLSTWAAWASEPPAPRTVPTPFPGMGRQLEGEQAIRPFSGLELPKVVACEAPAEGWHECVQSFVRHSFSRRLCATGELDHWRQPGSMDREELKNTIFRASRRLQSKIESAVFSLSLQPRGVGEGMFLERPLIDDTPVEQRGVAATWWRAVANSCPFVYTRTAAACFIEPLTRAHGCPLFFFVPPEFRRRAPRVFISHAWDGSVWDLRPPETDESLWLDLVALRQVTDVTDGTDLVALPQPMASAAVAAASAASAASVASVTASVASVPAPVTSCDSQASMDDVRRAVTAIGRTCVICPADDPVLPFLRSWCVYEVALTPVDALLIHVGWGEWDLSVHEEVRRYQPSHSKT